MVHARLILLALFAVACGSSMPVAGDAGAPMDSSAVEAEAAADADITTCQNCVCYQGICAKRLFASSRTYDGAAIQSTTHADAECAAMAKAAGMNGYWLAWISDGLGSSPATRFDAPYPGPYVLAKNPTILVVKTADDFSKKLAHAIDHDENGMMVAGFAWTQTDAFGDAVPSGVVSGDACGDWTSAGTLKAATTGLLVGLSSWSWPSKSQCDQLGRIYCFEQ